MPVMHGNKLLVWGDDIDPKALEQAEQSATLPFIVGHVALMPDAAWLTEFRDGRSSTGLLEWFRLA